MDMLDRPPLNLHLRLTIMIFLSLLALGSWLFQQLWAAIFFTQMAVGFAALTMIRVRRRQVDKRRSTH